jgi:hypothetical protein
MHFFLGMGRVYQPATTSARSQFCKIILRRGRVATGQLVQLRQDTRSRRDEQQTLVGVKKAGHRGEIYKGCSRM